MYFKNVLNVLRLFSLLATKMNQKILVMKLLNFFSCNKPKANWKSMQHRVGIKGS